MFKLDAAERNSECARTMTPVALGFLIEAYYLADVQVQTAAQRMVANFLVRAGLLEFRDPQAPRMGLKRTRRGEVHV